MRFEPRRAFSIARIARPRPIAVAVPVEIAFLADYGVPRDVLRAAAQRALAEGIEPSRALLASGEVSETRFYYCLAHRLGVPFIVNWPRPALPLDLRRALDRRRFRLADDPRAAWLTAPAGVDIVLMFDACTSGIALPSLAITTPSHLDEILRHRAQSTIAYEASQALPDQTPALSARNALGLKGMSLIVLVLAALFVGAVLGLRAVDDVLGIVFLAGIVFRLAVCAQGAAPSSSAPPAALHDDALPTYSVLVPLHDEAAMVPGLAKALGEIDYPRAKIEVLFLIEAGDRATRDALEYARLPPGFRIVDVPNGAPRTKPRALNAGLLLARGTLVVVYDAEDRPDPNQLRLAAARFAQAPAHVACLQARLAISNGANGLLAKLFAIEYATLFDVFNVGLARFGLPIALGGTSNHFRSDALCRVGAWDAWNVTEDADLGLRLARFGYAIDMLDSTTWEEAPERLGDWFKQRRRWTKGWMQTLLVLARDMPTAVRDLGATKSLVVTLMLTNLVTGPLLTPLFLVLVTWHLAADGLPTPRGALDVAEATLAFSVIGIGVAGTVWSGIIGARRRGLAGILGLLALSPYQLLISAAACGGLADLFVRPYHWHKTQHGEAARKRQNPIEQQASNVRPVRSLSARWRGRRS